VAAVRKDRKGGKPPRRKTDREPPLVQVRRLHRRDLNKAWEFLKRSFRDVNLETVEYQRPRSKKRFFETYEEEGVEQLLFVADGAIVAYTECTYEIIGSDTWINPRYFEKRDMRPLYVEELAVDPDWHGRGVGSFVLEQIQHLAKVRGLTHLVLEVAENNTNAMLWYRKRGFRKLDASVFMAYAVDVAPELLPPRILGSDKDASPVDNAVLVVPVEKPAKGAATKVAAKPAVGAKPAPSRRGKVERAATVGKVERAATVGKVERAATVAKVERAATAEPIAAMAARGPGARESASDPASTASEEARNGQRRPARAGTAQPASPPTPPPTRRRPE
jgi:ribosomal protein S18 acetylase RimI-like enzyme